MHTTTPVLEYLFSPLKSQSTKPVWITGGFDRASSTFQSDWPLIPRQVVPLRMKSASQEMASPIGGTKRPDPVRLRKEIFFVGSCGQTSENEMVIFASLSWDRSPAISCCRFLGVLSGCPHSKTTVEIYGVVTPLCSSRWCSFSPWILGSVSHKACETSLTLLWS